MRIFSIIILVATLVVSSAVNAKINDNEEQYNAAIQEYQSQVLKGLNEELVPYAKNLYELGKLYLPSDSVDLGVIAQNYAIALNFRHSDPKSIIPFKHAIDIYSQLEKLPLERLINVSYDLGRVYIENRKYFKKSKGKFKEAINFANDSNNKLLLAKTKLRVGISYVSSGFITRRELIHALSLLESSYEFFHESSDRQKMIAAFWLGKANMRLKKSETAIKHFSLVLDNKLNTKESSKLEMMSHAFLVDAYSRNNEPDKATEHCQAIGEVTPWKENSELTPLYIVQPKYPRSAAKSGREGWVKIKMLIDSYGFVKDPEVIKSSGSSRFQESALKAINKWRFSPKFVGGKPVDAVSIYTLQFRLAR